MCYFYSMFTYLMSVPLIVTVFTINCKLLKLAYIWKGQGQTKLVLLKVKQ